MITISLGGTWRTRLQIDRYQRKQESEKIRQIVSGLGEQRQGMGTDAGHDQQHDVGERHAKRNFENSRGSALSISMDVHNLKCTGGEVRLQAEQQSVRA